MLKTMAKTSIAALLIIVILCICLHWIGNKLDTEADDVIDTMYSRDKNGIINGDQSIIYQKQNSNAIIFIHGFASSPRVFLELIDELKSKANSDIYAPLLPFNGRNLKILSSTNDQINLAYLEKIINNFSKIYQHITIIGLSYGGAQLANLTLANKIPDNATIILYAPAFYLQDNNFFQNNLAKLYLYFRKYCDYEILGCEYPNYASADSSAKDKFMKQNDFPYTSIPAVLTLFAFDKQNRESISNIHRPFNLIIAEDDNRVSYKDLKQQCEQNKKYCKLFTFKSGKHLIHWGENKQAFRELILGIYPINF